MATLINKKTGQPEQVADNLLDATLDSGDYDLAPGQKIAVIAPDGERGTVDSEKYLGARGDGFRLEDTGDTLHRKEAAEYEGRELETGTRSFFNTVSGGMWEAAMPRDEREEFQRLRQYNEGGALVGDIAGSLVPVGAGGAAARAGQTLGGLAERAIGRTALAAGGRGAKLASKLIPAAVASGTEGAVLGGVQGFSQASLSEDPFNVEAALAKIGTGALFGAGVGAGIGSAGVLVGEAAVAARDGARRLADSARAAVAKRKGIGDELLQAIAAKPAQDSTLRAGAKAEIRRLTEEAGGEGERLALERAAGAEDAAGQLRRLDDATKGFKGDLERLDRESRIAGGRARKELAKAADLEVAGEQTAAGQALAKLEAAREEVRRHFDFDWTPGKGAKDAKTFALKMDDDAIRTAIQKPEAKAALQAQEQATLDLLAALDPSKKYVNQFGRAADELGALAPRQPELQQKIAALAEPIDSPGLQRIQTQVDDLERAIKAGADPVAAAKKTIGLAEGAGMKATPEQLLAAAQAGGLPLEKLTPDLEILLKAKVYRQAAGAQLAARGLKPAGLGGAVGAAADMATGMAVDKLLDGALGFALGRVAGGVVGKVVKTGLKGAHLKVMEQIGSVASRIADGLDTWIGRTTAKAAKVAAEGGRRRPGVLNAAAVLGGLHYSAEAEKGPAPKTAEEAYLRRADEIRQALGNREATARSIFDRLTGIGAIDIGLASQLAEAALRKLEYLGSQLATPEPVGSMYKEGGTNRWRPSETEINRFARIADAAEDPVGAILEGMQSGRLMPTVVDTVRQVAPAILSRFQDHLSTALGELREDLPYEKRMVLTVLFDVPIDSSASPAFVAAMQANFTAPQNQPRDLSKAAIGSVKQREEPTAGQKLAG